VIIDAHHHFWDPAAAPYPWLTDELAVIRRRFGPEDLAPELAAAGVEATILVQTRSSLAESREFLALAGSSSFVRGVIGWVDLTDPAIADVIAGLRAGPGGDRLVGIRHQVHDEPDDAWLTRADVRRGIRAVGAAGLAFDLLVRARELPAALELGRSLEEVRFVVDHLAKPPIAAGAIEPWSTLIGGFGPLENVACKLTGLVTEASWATWRVQDLRPYVDRALEVFGAGRLIFGSDWPVCLLAAGYGEVLDAVRQLTAGWSPRERAAVFAENARATYGL
jgi:L-fuconolactonase